MRGRKLIVDWKHTAEELYARYKQVGLTQLSTAIRGQLLPTPAEKLWATA